MEREPGWLRVLMLTAWLLAVFAPGRLKARAHCACDRLSTALALGFLGLRAQRGHRTLEELCRYAPGFLGPVCTQRSQILGCLVCFYAENCKASSFSRAQPLEELLFNDKLDL